jgi:hypothetical protein
VKRDRAVSTRAGFITNAVAALVVALYAGLILSGFIIAWTPNSNGDFGLTLGQTGFYGGTTVKQVEPDSAGDRAGIKPGDIVERPLELRDRLLMTGLILPRPGELVTVSIARGSGRHTVTLRAARAKPLSAIESVATALLLATLILYVVVGFALVLLRPSKMTWGFCLFGFLFVTLFNPYMWNNVSQILPPVWLLALTAPGDVLVPAGMIGFLVFCLRFPTNILTSRWQRAIDASALYLIVVFTILISMRDIAADEFAPEKVTSSINRLGDVSGVVILILGIVVLLFNYFNAHGLERQRIKWVVVGVACAFIGMASQFIGVEIWPTSPDWMALVGALPFIPLPIAIAYAVIRHRVIDVRFILTRSFAIAVIVAVVALIFIAVDWLFSVRLPTSRLEASLYAAIILLIGFSLNAMRQRLGMAVDRLFFRQWQRTKEDADILADTLRRARLTTELYEPLTGGVASAFSLASAALFERVEDGGFVRVAAVGWPAGTTWHIMPDDPLIKLADDRLRVVDVDTFRWPAADLPAGHARPAAMVPIVAGRRVPAILLLGGHENGTGLDPDELRIIRRLAADAGLVYGMPGVDSEAIIRAARVVGM